MGRLSGWLDAFDDGAWAPDWLRRIGSKTRRSVGYENYPYGLELVEDADLAASIRDRAWPRRMWLGAPIVVPDDDFVDPESAQRIAGVRSHGGVTLLCARGILRSCYRASDGSEGITRTSSEAEALWKQSAPITHRLRRRLGGILHWIG